MKKVIYLNVQSNGLRGDAFAIGACIRENGKTVEEIQFLAGNMKDIENEYVISQILPQFENMKITHETKEEMLKDFAEWYLDRAFENGNNTIPIVGHMANVVDAKLFDDMYKLGYIGLYQSPYAPIDIADYLRIKGEAPDSVDAYITKHKIELSEDYAPNIPLKRCEAMYKTLEHLTRE